MENRNHKVDITIKGITLQDLQLLRNAISDLQDIAVQGQLRFLEAIIDSLSDEELNWFRKV